MSKAKAITAPQAKRIPTTAAGTAVINKCLDNAKFQQHVSYLYGRWLDESQYEDIKEYGNSLKKILPKNVKLRKMTKRPFGFEFSITTPGDAENVYAFFCKSNSMGWKRNS